MTRIPQQKSQVLITKVLVVRGRLRMIWLVEKVGELGRLRIGGENLTLPAQTSPPPTSVIFHGGKVSETPLQLHSGYGRE